MVLPTSPDAAAPRLFLTLIVSKKGDVTLRSCEIVGAKYRNRTSFTSAAGLHDVLSTALADALSDCVGRLGAGKEVLSLPDFRLQAPGLSLAGIHMLVTEDIDNSRQIICRFKHFMGTLESVVAQRFGLGPQLAAHREKVLTDTLIDIAMPLFNICKTEEMRLSSEQGNSKTARALVELSQKSHEIAFYTELLKRFVNEVVEQAPTFANQDLAYQPARYAHLT